MGAFNSPDKAKTANASRVGVQEGREQQLLWPPPGQTGQWAAADNDNLAGFYRLILGRCCLIAFSSQAAGGHDDVYPHFTAKGMEAQTG